MHFAFLGALMWGLYYTVYASISTKASYAYMMFYGSVYCALITAPFALREKFNPDVLKLIAVERTFGLLAAFCLYNAVRSIGVTTASVIESMYPFFVALFALLIYKERPSIEFIIGTCLIFSGITLISYNKN